MHTIIAVESGSRAWGFPSKDSDYDVRIIYRHQPDWYLLVFRSKDHITLPINAELDIAGWDIRKVLLLLFKGNAVVHEWFRSSIVYEADTLLVNQLREFADRVFDPAAVFRHYLAMAAKKLEYQSGSVTAKQLLYGYRTLLCAEWVAEYASAPPMEFARLMTTFLDNQSEVENALTELISLKEHGLEKDTIEVQNPLLRFSAEQLKALRRLTFEKQQLDRNIFDQAFKKFILE